MAALIANKSSIQMRHHGPELNPEDAIGAADERKGHNHFLDRTAKAKRQRSVKNRVTAAFAARWE
jgi:hypothetical protein